MQFHGEESEIIFEGSLKGGYINMPNIRTTKSSADNASQHFFFAETMISFGGFFRL